MCNTYVCVLYHSSYMSSVIRMWISSIWLSKNTPVDALKIHHTRSDTPPLWKTSIVFLPKCTYILIFFHQCVCCPNRSAWGGYLAPKTGGREAHINPRQCFNLQWGGAALSTRATGTCRDQPRSLGLHILSISFFFSSVYNMEEFSNSIRLEEKRDEKKPNEKNIAEVIPTDSPCCENFKETMIASLWDDKTWPTLPAPFCSHHSLHPGLAMPAIWQSGCPVIWIINMVQVRNTPPREGERLCLAQSVVRADSTSCCCSHGRDSEPCIRERWAWRAPAAGGASAGLVPGTLTLWKVAKRSCKHQVISALT